MVYASDANKWRAYQFLDPFAAGSFLVCNKVNKTFCRPDCDAHPTTELRSLIKFVDTTQEAVALGYVPCDSCGPMSVPKIDVNLLLRTVKDCNNRIGFVPPLMDDDESKITETIKENIIGQGMQRRQLVPAVTSNSNKFANDKASGYSVSKNDSEHYRLIDLACRHLALAAANSIFSLASSSASLSPASDDGSAEKKKNTKKRRGGVLGFKELAAKSKLSAWHFHRVFKSITGLTPKNYGDMCWEYLEKDKNERGSVLSPPATVRDSPILPLENNINSGYGNSSLPQDQDLQSNNSAFFKSSSNKFSYISPTHSSTSQSGGLLMASKRAREDDYDDLEYSPKRIYLQLPTGDNLNNSNNGYNVDSSLIGNTYNSGSYDMKYESDFGPYVDFSNRATSVPDLMLYGNSMPSSLFEHSKPLDAPLQFDELEASNFSPTSVQMSNEPAILIQDPYIPTEDLINEAMFAEPEAFNTEFFPEARIDLFSQDLAMNDPTMMTFLPEVVTGIE